MIRQRSWTNGRVRTWGKGVSDDRRTFSGLRSQWTMWREWRCFNAIRIYKTTTTTTTTKTNAERTTQRNHRIRWALWYDTLKAIVESHSNIRQIMFTGCNSNDFVLWLRSIENNPTSATVISIELRSTKGKKSRRDSGNTFINHEAVLPCIMKIDKTFHQAVYSPSSLKS